MIQVLIYILAALAILFLSNSVVLVIIVVLCDFDIIKIEIVNKILSTKREKFNYIEHRHTLISECKSAFKLAVIVIVLLIFLK
jgi:hypothetical protein